ncbi:hypothetical protein LZ32DRAFT_597775 [Colletotrichum eremochloae]|nr:hypothetical protein LZ32DRAFT_597775 [Colletotrichum eremochloae]
MYSVNHAIADKEWPLLACMLLLDMDVLLVVLVWRISTGAREIQVLVPFLTKSLPQFDNQSLPDADRASHF